MEIERSDIKKVFPCLYEISRDFRADMRVPARFYATEEMLEQILTDRSLEQLVNVATLPGVVKYVLGMPDIHEGYGFPIGGVAAIRIRDGVISPGGIGYDINCGIRLLTTNLTYEEIKNRLKEIVDAAYRKVPSGVGKGGPFKLSDEEMNQVLEKGARWAVERGYGVEKDMEFLEEKGFFEGADFSKVSLIAKKRGRDQLGTLGAGNHFVEIQRTDKIFSPPEAEFFGLKENQITVLIHTGSRGLGHQVCADYVRLMHRKLEDYDIKLPDPELAAVPFGSKEGQDYFSAMKAAANFAWANRQVIMHWVREVFRAVLKNEALELDVVYDVAHNIAKREKYFGEEVVVHRKGATRAFGPGSGEIPKKFRSVGQPVLIPGSMGTSSYVLVGTEKAMQESFGTVCHGAGRAMSRAKAKKMVRGERLKQELEEKGIIIRAGSLAGLAEEVPFAYKDVDDVVRAVEAGGIAKRVARMKPLAVIKG